MAEQEKPDYGPLMSPAIFSAKWLRVFYDLLQPLNTPPGPGDKANIEDLGGMLSFPEKAFACLPIFHAQAKAHSLVSSDFPPDKLGQETTSFPSLGRYTKAEFVNPFKAAEQVLITLMSFVPTFADWKTGDLQSSGMFSWQGLPLSTRRRINDLVEAVRKASVEEWWKEIDVSGATTEGPLKFRG